LSETLSLKIKHY